MPGRSALSSDAWHVALLRIRWELRTIAGRYPGLARRFITRSGNAITDETDIVIEGFARTGNTFAVTAFVRAQPGFVSVAHHVHVPAQVIAAVQRDVPCVVLIREPEETALSLAVRLRHLTLREVLRGYLRFYEPLLPLRQRFVIAPFDRVIADFGRVIAEVNERYRTSFVVFEHTSGNVEAVMAEVDRADIGAFAGDVGAFERSRARPTPSRRAMKEALRSQYWSRSLWGLRVRADSVYAVFVGG